ncbi:MAG: O-antigen ligase family protein [Candidatus Sumerlaeia bacterium]|nr:O-antigen ligase family protein [Candidatus Sumerlaeia bacterium]
MNTPFERRLGWLPALLLAAMPLLVVPAAADSFVLPKWTLLALGATALLAAALMRALRERPVRIVFHPATGLLLVWLLWSLLSIAWADSRLLAWRECGQLALVLAFVLATQSLLARRRDDMLRIGGALAASSLLVAAWTLSQDFRFAFAPEGLRFRAVLGDWRDAISAVALGNSGHVGDFLALGFLIWLAVLAGARSRRLALLAAASLAAHAAALIAAWSVHSNLSLIVGSAVMALLVARDRVWGWRRRALRWGSLAVAFAAVVAFYTLDSPANPHGSRVWGGGDPAARGGVFAQAFASERWQDGWPTRVAIWLTSLEIVRQQPWAGVGAGNFTYAYPATTSDLVAADEALSRYAGMWTNAAHNDAIQLWAELGVPGLAILLALAGTAFWRILSRMAEATPGTRLLLATGGGMLAAQLVQMQMSFPLQLPLSLLLFAFLVSFPEFLPPRGAEIRGQFLVPVQRRFGPLSLRVTLANFQIPRDISVSFRLEPAARLAASVVLAAGAAALAIPATRPLRADIAYREAREARFRIDAARPEGPLPPRGQWALADAYEDAARRALAIWPGHVDCRSGLSGHLLRQGRWEEALAESEIVLRGLNAVEVWERMAVANQALGRADAAAASFDEVFTRRPDFGFKYPGPYGTWIAGKEEGRN